MARDQREDGDRPARATAQYEEIPWDAQEDEVTARVFDELDRQWRREEQRAQRRQQVRHPNRNPR